MRHALSPADLEFRAAFEACRVAPAAFDHRAHLRLAYVYLTEHAPEVAAARMRASLLAFLDGQGIDRAKYHATLTHAWLLAVRHFMRRSPPVPSADAFIEANPRLLDRKLLLVHYTAERLLSAEARSQYLAPDVAPFPETQQQVPPPSPLRGSGSG